MTTTWTALDPNLIGLRPKNGLDEQFLFYWSINSNCGWENTAANPPGGSLCRSLRNGGTPVQESNGSVALPYSADIRQYQVYIARDATDGKWKFVVKIYDPRSSASLLTSWIDPNDPEYWRTACD